MIITQSMLKAWRFCHANFDFKYNQKLKPKVEKIQLKRGTILHEMLDARANQEDPFRKLEVYEKKHRQILREEAEYYGDLIGDCRRIFENYLRTYEDEELTYMSSEVKMGHPIAGQHIVYEGTLDKIVRDKKGNLWLMDHKTHKKIPDADHRFADLQLVMYAWLYNSVKQVPLTGIIWDYIRAKPPAIPEQLKNGQLSQRSNIDTDYETYLAEIGRLNLNPKDYTEILSQLKQKKNTFFDRVILPIASISRMESIVEDARKDAQVIAELSPVLKTKNLNWQCPSCAYFRICQAELNGADAEFIKKAHYVKEVTINADEERDIED